MAPLDSDAFTTDTGAVNDPKSFGPAPEPVVMAEEPDEAKAPKLTLVASAGAPTAVVDIVVV